jgi:hypothetical protein
MTKAILDFESAGRQIGAFVADYVAKNDFAIEGETNGQKSFQFKYQGDDYEIELVEEFDLNVQKKQGIGLGVMSKKGNYYETYPIPNRVPSKKELTKSLVQFLASACEIGVENSPELSSLIDSMHKEIELYFSLMKKVLVSDNQKMYFKLNGEKYSLDYENLGDSTIYVTSDKDDRYAFINLESEREIAVGNDDGGGDIDMTFDDKNLLGAIKYAALALQLGPNKAKEECKLKPSRKTSKVFELG